MSQTPHGLTRPGRDDETPIYPPPTEPIAIPNADDLTFAECFRIKASTGVDVMVAAMNNDYTELMVAILWHIISQRPEYRGLTFENVKRWPMSKIAMGAPADDDADDVRETLQELDQAQQELGNFGDGIPFTGPSEHGSA